MGLKIALIAHPRGDPGLVEALRAEVARLRAAGHRVTGRVTFEAGDARAFARAAVRARVELVIVAGGDGTVNEVVNGVAHARWQPRLGIVPTGTANDFATGLGVPAELGAAVAVAVAGRPVAVDVGRVNERCFINVSTGGFGAEATEEAPAQAKRLLGPWAYVLSGARRFLEMRPVEARVVADGRAWYEGELLLFAVGNARQTGGGIPVTPRAELGDGALDVLVVPALPRLEFLALLPDLRAGTHLSRPDVLYRRARALVVETHEPVAVNADGEPMRGRRFRYGVLDRPLSVMVP